VMLQETKDSYISFGKRSAFTAGAFICTGRGVAACCKLVTGAKAGTWEKIRRKRVVNDLGRESERTYDSKDENISEGIDIRALHQTFSRTNSTL